MLMISFQDVGLLVLFACGVFAGFLLGYALGWFYNPHEPVPPGMVRKTFLEWFLEFFGLQRIKKKKSLSDMVMLDKDLVVPSPPESMLRKGVVLHADYETHKVTEQEPASQVQAAVEKKVSSINYEQE